LKPKVSKTQKKLAAQEKQTKSKKTNSAPSKKRNSRFVEKRKSNRPPKPRF
jgi:hypothetical protein